MYHLTKDSRVVRRGPRPGAVVPVGCGSETSDAAAKPSQIRDGEVTMVINKFHDLFHRLSPGAACGVLHTSFQEMNVTTFLNS